MVLVLEDDAASTIVQGTLITSGVSAFVTGLHGISTRKPNYGTLATAAAVNSGVTAVTFFGIREFAVSPLLVHFLPWPQYVRRRQELGIHEVQLSPLSPPTWSDMRRHKTLDSGLSGAIAGGLLRGWKSGLRAAAPGALTIGAVCTLLQLGYNELGVIRLKYLSNLGGSPSIPSSSVPGSSTRLMALFGVRPVSDEEYLQRMKIKREGYLKKIAVLEQQLAAENDEKSRAV